MHRTTARLLLAPMSLLLIGFLWFAGIRPLLGESHIFRHKAIMSLLEKVPKDKQTEVAAKAEQHLLAAFKCDPYNSIYHFDAFNFYSRFNAAMATVYLEQAIWLQNGDLTDYSLWYMRGMTKYVSGQIWDAKLALERAQFFYPLFVDIKQQLDRVNKIIEKEAPRR